MPGLNKRSVLNMNFLFGRDYVFINFIKNGGFTQGAGVDLSQLDAQGYPIDNSQVSGINPFSYIIIPASATTTGPYVLTWTGKGTIWLDESIGTWTVNAGLSSGYAEASNGHYSGTDAYIVVSLTGFSGAGAFPLFMRASDPDNTNNYVRNLKFYMRADETDLNAGKVFRSGWKQTILDLNPGCIRAMNWTGGSSGMQVRWSDRIPPDYISYVHYYGLVNYPQSTGTNVITVASASGMPVSMTHGEVAAFKLGGSALVTDAKRTVTGITKANPGVVTSAGHGFVNGQKVIFQIGQGRDSMHQLHFKVCTVANKTTDTFELSGLNTTGFSTFAATPDYDGNRVSEYISMNVGARGEYPVLGAGGNPPGYDGVQLLSGGYAHFVFDKYLVGNRDTGPGAWLCKVANATSSDYLIYEPGVPLEICTALVNELNAMKGTGGAINLWITTPPRALMSVDPNYSSAENWAVKAVDVCLNGSGSWPGLTSSAALLIEYSNETWNTAGGFYASAYGGRATQLRYDPTGGTGSTPFTLGSQDVNSWCVIRSIVMCQDLAAAYPTQIASGRLIRVAAGQGTYGIHVGGTGVNEPRVMIANANVMGEAWNVGATQPYTKFETFAWASYFDAAEGDNYPWYDAHWNTYTANYIAAAGNPTAQEAICSDWVTLGVRPAGEGTTAYGVKGGEFDSVLGGLGKTAIQYEGGYNWPGAASSTPAVSADQAAFLAGVQNSAAWAAEQKAFFNLYPSRTYSYHPSIYIQVSSNRWGYVRPNDDAWLGGVEGAALNRTWTAMGEYNDANDDGGGGGAVAGIPLMLAMRLRLHA